MLANSAYLMDIEYIARCFDETAKVRFRDAAGAQYIKFGSTKDNDVDVNIRFGQLKLSGQIVAEFFQPSIDCIVDAVKEQIMAKPDRFKVTAATFFCPYWLIQIILECRACRRLLWKPVAVQSCSGPAFSVWIKRFTRRTLRVGGISFAHEHQ